MKEVKNTDEKLLAALLDECEGVESYIEMANNADEKYRQILFDIAKEEHVHMQHIKSILDDMHIAIPDNAKESYDKAEQLYHSSF